MKFILNKMKYKLILNLTITSCLLITIQANAQSPNTKELTSLILSSFNHFPKIKEAENYILIATEKIKLVELNKQPDITADGAYSYVRPKIELPINGEKYQFAPLNNFSASFNGAYTLVDFGRIKAAIEQAKNELNFSQHNKENIQLQIAYQISNIYYYMIYLKRATAIQDTILNLLDENKKIIESQYKNGTALEIDLLSILSNIDIEENKKTEISSLLRKQEILLEYACGIPTIEGKEFDIKIMTSLENQNIELNPELIMMQDKIQQAKQDVSISQLKNKPIIGLRASMGTRNGYIPNISDMRFNYLGGIALSVPIYNGGKIKQQIKIQEILADQQRLSLESTKQVLNKDIKQTALDIKSAQDRLKRSASQIQLAKSASVLANNKLKHGTGTHLEVTSSNTNLQRSLLNQLQLEFQVCTAQLEMSRLSGIRFW